MNKDLIRIGRKDKINLPEFNIYNLDAKIDTGAYGNALHSHKIEIKVANGTETLHFRLLDPTHPEYEAKDFKTSSFRIKTVKSSTGHEEERYVIKTDLLLFDQKITTEFSLTDREKMKYPVLLGRKLLKGRFLVDVSKRNLSFKKNLSRD